MSKFWPAWPTQSELTRALSTIPRPRRRWFIICAVVFVASVISLLAYANDQISVVVPAAGGSLTEGIVGTPLYVNPVLAATDADRDLAMLIYSGLLRLGPKGELIPDLAEKYEVSDDGLNYTFTLRSGLEWQDGQTLSVDDVLFTVALAQDPLIKSPRRASWEGVTAEKVNERTIRFHLKQPFGAFGETATMGILPKHLWKQFSPDQFPLNQLNTEGIGSGPYRVSSVAKDARGIAQSYTLSAFGDFALGEPKISRLVLNFYPSETELASALRAGQIDSAPALSASSAERLSAGARLLTAPLTRIFGVFFNQNESAVLADSSVRQALDLAVDRAGLISAVLHGYGTAVAGPVPPSAALSTVNDDSTGDEDASSTVALGAARTALTRGGWTWEESAREWRKKTKTGSLILAFSLVTSDAPELKETAQALKEMWEALGAKVDLKIYEAGDLTKDIIRPRQYEALLFGEIVGRAPDLFSFWHSKQRLDPGYNIAGYTNASVDQWLEDLRSSRDPAARVTLENKIAAAISADRPAIFLYAPDFLYLLPDHVKNVNLPNINTPSDRFALIYEWYTNTDRVWKVFSH